MMHEVRFYSLEYPKNYVPGMLYKKECIGRTWISDLTRMSIGTESAIRRAAARLRITCSVDTFSLRQLNAVLPWFCGTL